MSPARVGILSLLAVFLVYPALVTGDPADPVGHYGHSGISHPHSEHGPAFRSPRVSLRPFHGR